MKQFEFYAGEDKRMEIVLKQLDQATGEVDHFDLTGSTEISVQVPGIPDNLNFTLTGNRCFIEQPVLGTLYIDLVAAETALMTDGSLLITVTIGGKNTIFLAEAAVKKQVMTDC